NYEADNAGNTQDNQEHKKEHHDPSTCHVRRFEMIKHSFDVDDEYVAIKEYEMQYGVSLGLGYGVLTTCTDLAVKKSTIWYTLKKTCVELIRAF
ncbi:hypothetical protein Tco_0878622, partial [Tanacetum coccineum]